MWQRAPVRTLPDSGLAIYTGPAFWDLPVVLLINEDDDFKLIALFSTDEQKARCGESGSVISEELLGGQGLKPFIESGSLVRIGTLPPKHVLFRLGMGVI